MKLEPWNREERVSTITDFFSKHFDFQSKKVLDIGCNTGHFTCAAVHLGAAHVTALDVSERLVNKTTLATEGLENVKIVHSDIFDFEFEQYDIILCCGVIYHTERQLELTRLIANHSKQSVIESMCQDRPGRLHLFRPSVQHGHITFVPRPAYFQALFNHSGLEVSEQQWLPMYQKDNQMRRIMYCLQRAGLGSPDSEAPTLSSTED